MNHLNFQVILLWNTGVLSSILSVNTFLYRQCRESHRIWKIADDPIFLFDLLEFFMNELLKDTSHNMLEDVMDDEVRTQNSFFIENEMALRLFLFRGAFLYFRGRLRQVQISRIWNKLKLFITPCKFALLYFVSKFSINREYSLLLIKYFKSISRSSPEFIKFY